MWRVGQPEANPCWGKQLPTNGQVLRRLFHFVRVQHTSVKEAASFVRAEVVVVWEKARITTQKKSRQCGEDPTALRIMAELGPVQEAER